MPPKKLYLYKSKDVSFDPKDYYLEEIQKDYKGFYPESHLINALERTSEIYYSQEKLNECCAENNDYLFLYFLLQHYRINPRIKEIKQARGRPTSGPKYASFR